MDPLRRKRVAALVVVLLVLGTATYYFAANPYTVLGFKPTLVQRSEGSLSFSSNGTTYSYLYVNVTIRFGPFGSIDPSRLNLTVTGPGGELLAFPGYPSLRGIPLVYYSNSFPHWIATRGIERWTGYTATVVNPDGAVVGGPVSPTGNAADTVESGATVTVTFPASLTSAQGYALTVSYEGAPGSVTISLADGS